jgi:hypothetical protein
VTATRACCVVRRFEELLVEEAIDPEAGVRAFRPLGDRVGDGEDPEEVVRAAFSDVLGVELEWLTAVGTYDGTRVFEASVDDDWLYSEDGFTVYDPESGETTRVCWLHREDFEKYGETLQPEGLLADL